ncbi:MAG: flagellin [Oscillospiraceae bacterium]|nr:flagellin [Oscillospiraceae bacterium]
MIIQHNIPAMNSHRQLSINNASTSKNLEKLSSGFRINRAGDDAAGLAISEKMRGQIRGLAMATQNAQNGISLIQTAEGGLNETHAILQRMRELAVQSANGTYHDEVDRDNIEKEVAALKSEIDRISSSTNYNGIQLLNGTLGGLSGDTATGTFGGTALSAILPLVGNGLQIDNTVLANELAGSDATVTISTIINDSVAITNVQIGDKSYTTRVEENGGWDEGTLYDANGVSIGVISLGTLGGAASGSSVVSGLRLNEDGTGLSTGSAADGPVLAEGAMYADGSNKLIFQIGANGSADQRVGLNVSNMSAGMIGIPGQGMVNNISVATSEDAKNAIKVLTAATNQISGTRADLGALQNRLEHTINNLGVTRENLQNAEASIRDVDMAKEMMEFTKNNILVQASQAMLAQSNQLPQGVLQLLR